MNERAQYDEDNFTRKDATISLTTANLVAIPLLFVSMLLFLLPHALIWGWETLVEAVRGSVAWLFWLLALLAIVVHEGLHALGWAVAGDVPWDKFKFGVKDLTPYAHVTVPMPVTGYRIGAALPGLVLGVIPGLIGLVTGYGTLTFWGALFTGVAAGDAMIVWLLRDAPADALVRDHPEKAGCELLIPKNRAGVSGE